MSSAQVSRSIEVAAPADRVWELVSDLPGMGRFSPENAGGSWLAGAAGPGVGVAFRGRNRSGLRRWSTRSTVTACTPGRVFAFDVTAVGLPAAVWSYTVEPTEAGCRLTETWEDRRGALLSRLGGLATGVSDRTAFTAASIEHTLNLVKEQAEQL